MCTKLQTIFDLIFKIKMFQMILDLKIIVDTSNILNLGEYRHIQQKECWPRKGRFQCKNILWNYLHLVGAISSIHPRTRTIIHEPGGGKLHSRSRSLSIGSWSWSICWSISWSIAVPWPEARGGKGAGVGCSVAADDKHGGDDDPGEHFNMFVKKWMLFLIYTSSQMYVAWELTYL